VIEVECLVEPMVEESVATKVGSTAVLKDKMMASSSVEMTVEQSVDATV
jgi:hypothetical protein